MEVRVLGRGYYKYNELISEANRTKSLLINIEFVGYIDWDVARYLIN